MTSESKSTDNHIVAATAPTMFITSRRIGLAFFALLCVGVGIAALLLKPAIIAGVLAAGLFALLIMLYPYFGLLVLYLDLVVAPAAIWPQLGALHPDLTLGIAALISVIIHNKLKGERFVLFQERMTWLLILFAGALVASVPTSVWPSQSMLSISNFINTLVFYLLMVNVLTTEKRLAGFIWVFILSGGYTAISSAIAYLGGNFTFAQGIDRAQSLAGADPNTLANSLVLAVPFMAFAIGWAKGRFLKLVSIMLAIASVFTIAITGSRGGVMGLLVVLFLIWLTSKHRLVTMMIFLVVVAIGWLALPEQYKARYSSVTSVATGEVDPSTQGRYNAWHAGVNMFYARPLFGIGVGDFSVAYASGDYSNQRHWLAPHSLYVQIIAELGLAGVLTFVPLIFYMMRQNFRLRKLMRKRDIKSGLLKGVSYSITCSIGALFITSITAHSLFRLHWYWCCALTVVIWRIFRDTNPEKVQERAPDKLRIKST
jgi:putative inorganic carbon (hco3(-)) transporter